MGTNLTKSLPPPQPPKAAPNTYAIGFMIGLCVVLALSLELSMLQNRDRGRDCTERDCTVSELSISFRDGLYLSWRIGRGKRIEEDRNEGRERDRKANAME